MRGTSARLTTLVAATALTAALAGAPAVAAVDTIVVRPTEFSQGITIECPIPDIVRGPDGNLWIAEYSNHSIGRVTPQGLVSEFGIGDPADAWGLPASIAVGPDKNIWFVTLGGRVGRMTTQGQPTLFEDGITGFKNEIAGWYDLSAVQPPSIARGPDGNLWFTELGPTIGRITPQGQVTEFDAGANATAVETTEALSLGRFGGITAGPDGNLWFTELRGAVGRITPQGQVTEFDAGISDGSVPQSIVAGPDGNLWFTELFGGRIGRITTKGVVTEFGLDPGSTPQGIDTGPDGALWFAARGSRALGRITTAGAITLYTHQSNPYWQPSAVTGGAGSTVWFARTGVVGILDPAKDGLGSTSDPVGTTPLPAIDTRTPTARKLRLEGRRLSMVLSERATVTARAEGHTVRWHLHAGAVAVRVPLWFARVARRGVMLVLSDASGNERRTFVRGR